MNANVSNNQAGAVDVWGKHVEFAIAAALAREAAKAADADKLTTLIKERSNG